MKLWARVRCLVFFDSVYILINAIMLSAFDSNVVVNASVGYVDIIEALHMILSLNFPYNDDD